MIEYVAVEVRYARQVAASDDRNVALAASFRWPEGTYLQWRVDSSRGLAVLEACQSLGIPYEIRGVQVGGGMVG